MLKNCTVSKFTKKRDFIATFEVQSYLKSKVSDHHFHFLDSTKVAVTASVQMI